MTCVRVSPHSCGLGVGRWVDVGGVSITQHPFWHELGTTMTLHFLWKGPRGSPHLDYVCAPHNSKDQRAGRGSEQGHWTILGRGT